MATKHPAPPARCTATQGLDALALPHQRLSLYALGSDALDIFGKDGLDGLDLDAFLGTVPCAGTGGSPGNQADTIAPIAPGSRTTVTVHMGSAL